jgi:hypothetical protein
VIRLASALILAGLVPAAQILLGPTGTNAIRFTFFGMPCLIAGIGLYVLTRLRKGDPPTSRRT